MSSPAHLLSMDVERLEMFKNSYGFLVHTTVNMTCFYTYLRGLCQSTKLFKLKGKKAVKVCLGHKLSHQKSRQLGYDEIVAGVIRFSNSFATSLHACTGSPSRQASRMQRPVKESPKVLMCKLRKRRYT